MIINDLKEIITRANPNYIQDYEENSMMNKKADDFKYEKGFVYIEEFTQGAYSVEKYRHIKITRIQIWFCRFTQMHNTAIEREEIRNQIENEIVRPFMKKYNESGKFTQIDTWQFYTPLPRFDANEVSIMLQFDLKNSIC